jgi:uncharacterized repeat protein (TIGR01451 family)
MAHRTKFSHLLTELLPILLCVLAVGGLLLGVQPASAAPCMDDVFPGKLQCTANDVRIAFADNIRDLNGDPLSECVSGQEFSFIADFHVELTAQARFDIGLYFATDGDPNNDGALTGLCAVNTISEANSPNFINLDSPENGGNQPTDTCGDIDDDNNPQVVTVQINNALCEDSDGDGKANLPNCTSWRQPGANQVCTSPAHAFPGSPSKCNCDIAFNIPVDVEPPTISVVKTPNPTSVNYPGGNVTFTVTVTNEGDPASGNVTLNTIVEDPDSNPATNNSTTFNAVSICLDTVLSPGESTTCTFTQPVTADLTSTGRCGTVTDRLTVNGLDDEGNPVVGVAFANVDVVRCFK